MTETISFNISQQSSGLLKIDPAELLSINKSISTINSANITITTNLSISNNPDNNFNLYILPENMSYPCTSCHRVNASNFSCTGSQITMNISSYCQSNYTAQTPFYIRVSPLTDVNVSISASITFGVECVVPTNWRPFEAQTTAYTSFDATPFGTANVNLKDGNFSFTHTDWQFGGGKTSFALLHTYRGVNYDSDEFYTSFHTYTGKGWKTNYHQYLVGDDENAIFIDAAGNRHTFSKNNDKIYDNSGLGLTLTHDSTTKTLTDELGNKLTFNLDHLLTKIENIYGNTLSLSYTNSLLTNVSDGTNTATFTYDSTTGLLKTISYSSTQETLEFTYSNGYLNTISKKNGTTTRLKAAFNYTNGKLSKITNGEYTSFNVNYNNNKVSSMSINSDSTNSVTLKSSAFEYNTATNKTIETFETGAKYQYELYSNGDLKTVSDVSSNGSLTQLYPSNNTNESITSTTYLGSIALDNITKITNSSNTTLVSFGGTNILTLEDIRASLYSYYKNSASFDFYYNNKRDRLCNCHPSDCKINGSLTFSATMLKHETLIKDKNNSTVMKIVDTEECTSSGRKTTSICYQSNETTKLSEKVSIVDYAGKQISNTDNTNNISSTNSYDSFGNLTGTSTTYNGSTLSISASYGNNGEHKESFTDERGNTTTYDYFAPYNVIQKITPPAGAATTFEYDTFKENITKVSFGSGITHTITLNAKNKIYTLAHGGTTYYFTYNDAGDLTKIEAGNASSKITVYNHTYNYSSTNKSETHTYGDGTAETTTYNKYGKPQSVSVGSTSATFSYTPSGNSLNSKSKLTSISDGFAGNTITYYPEDTSESEFSCSGTLNWSKKNYISDRETYEAYTFDSDVDCIAYTRDNYESWGSPTSSIKMKNNYSSSTGGEFLCEYKHDNFNRLTSRTYTSPNNKITAGQTYTYHTKNNNSSGITRFVNTETCTYNRGTASRTRTYTYDSNGNVTRVSGNNNSCTYQYDTYNRLTREINTYIDRDITYSYNTNGNISSKITKTCSGSTISEESFSYNSVWGDLLQSHSKYGSIEHTNEYPKTHNGYSVTWERGLLKSYTFLDTSSNVDVEITYTFTYDIFGRRIKREGVKKSTVTYNTPTTYYYYDNDRLIAEKEVANGATATLIHYIYDDEGLSGFKVKLHSYDNVDANLKTDTNGFLFFQVTKDIFGNIVRVDSENGIALECEYDAFGNRYITNEATISDGYYSIPMSELCNIGYKGYYYDSGAKLYYTGTRYYNPETGRYLSPNKATNLQINAINGLNLFDFYNNNPLRPIALTKGEYKTNINAIEAPRLETQAKPLPAWHEYIGDFIDFNLSVANIVHIANYLRKNPTISDLAAFNNITELSLRFSKIVSKIGKGLIILNVALDIYDNAQKGFSSTNIAISAAYTLITGLAVIKLTSAILSIFCVTSILWYAIIAISLSLVLSKIFDIIKQGCLN